MNSCSPAIISQMLLSAHLMEIRLAYHGSTEERVHFDLGVRNGLKMLYRASTFKCTLQNKSDLTIVKLWLRSWESWYAWEKRD